MISFDVWILFTASYSMNSHHRVPAVTDSLPRKYTLPPRVLQTTAADELSKLSLGHAQYVSMCHQQRKAAPQEYSVHVQFCDDRTIFSDAGLDSGS